MKISCHIQDHDTNDLNMLHDEIAKYLENVDLNLKALQEVIVTSNFFQDIKRLQVRLGLKNDGASNNKNARAIAKTIFYGDSLDRKSMIVIDASLGLEIISPNEHERLNGIHALHHELAHVHDDSFKNNIFSENERRGEGVNKLIHYQRIVADKIWSEYFAERMSANSTTINHIQMLIKLLKIQGSNLVHTFNAERENYFKHKDTLKAFDNVSDTMHYFLKTLGMIIGILDGDSCSEIKEILEDEVSGFIGDSHFFTVYDNLRIELSKTFSRYHNWTKISEIDSLGSQITDAWLWLGFRIVAIGDTFRIDIRTN